MKLSDFILLNEEEKKFAVLHLGVLVGKRQLYGQMVFLFQLDSYYVETYCNWHSKAVEEYRVSDNIRTLSPYLESISLEGLMN
ncbi:MAG TPA: hypothetical protein VJ499_03185 [Flavisolibacter sp.]|nr:hypothetical protein [Flavisolibacter sp.]